MEERLQKYMARCGVASRRKSEEMILEGLVAVNGKVVTELGAKIRPGKDQITVNGKPLRTEEKVYYILNKPKGCTASVSDEMGRRTVMDLLGKDVKERVYPVGRLDRDSEGLILLTNDGEFAHYMTHPSFGVKKVYRATVEGEVDQNALADAVKNGIRMGPALIKPQSAKIIKKLKTSTIVEIVVGEGINREVRRLFLALGHEVTRLLRITEGPLSIRGISKSGYRKLNRKELETIFKAMGKAELVKDELPAPPKVRTRYFSPDGKRAGKPDPAMGAAKSGRPADDMDDVVYFDKKTKTGGVRKAQKRKDPADKRRGEKKVSGTARKYDKKSELGEKRYESRKASDGPRKFEKRKDAEDKRYDDRKSSGGARKYGKKNETESRRGSDKRGSTGGKYKTDRREEDKRPAGRKQAEKAGDKRKAAAPDKAGKARFDKKAKPARAEKPAKAAPKSPAKKPAKKSGPKTPVHPITGK
ncbi:MAG: pseudouridine synthase [Planctomycetes bacterium]|nr:pseudouridine synthase [Planctomycetota bacterium]